MGMGRGRGTWGTRGDRIGWAGRRRPFEDSAAVVVLPLRGNTPPAPPPA